jgi:hypothetical protein
MTPCPADTARCLVRRPHEDRCYDTRTLTDEQRDAFDTWLFDDNACWPLFVFSEHVAERCDEEPKR